MPQVVKTEIKTFNVELTCCGKPMARGGSVLMSFPAQYTYTCICGCGEKVTSPDVYPRIDYEPVERT